MKVISSIYQLIDELTAEWLLEVRSLIRGRMCVCVGGGGGYFWFQALSLFLLPILPEFCTTTCYLPSSSHSLQPTNKEASSVQKKGKVYFSSNSDVPFHLLLKNTLSQHKEISISPNSHWVFEIMGSAHRMRFQILFHLNLNIHG